MSYYTCLSSQFGDSALMKAASWGETKVVVELVKSGADLNLQNEVCATSTNVLCCVMWNIVLLNREETRQWSRLQWNISLVPYLSWLDQELTSTFRIRWDTQLLWTLHFIMYHSILGGSDCSDDISKEWGDRGHRYSPNWRKHWPRHSGECETPDYITHYWVTQYSYPFPTEHRMVSSLLLCSERRCYHYNISP